MTARCSAGLPITGFWPPGNLLPGSPSRTGPACISSAPRFIKSSHRSGDHAPTACVQSMARCRKCRCPRSFWKHRPQIQYDRNRQSLDHSRRCIKKTSPAQVARNLELSLDAKARELQIFTISQGWVRGISIAPLINSNIFEEGRHRVCPYKFPVDIELTRNDLLPEVDFYAISRKIIL